MASVAAPSASFAQTVPTATTAISGTVVAQENGLSVAGASVILYQGTTAVDKTTSNGDGHYAFTGKQPGIYAVEVTATGYQGARVEDVATTAGGTATLRTTLLRAQTANLGGLNVIGSTSVTRQRQSLETTTVIQHNLDTAQLQQQGFLKAADAIAQLPGVNLTGGPHTIGDDTFIDIRGMGSGEVRPLIDGHPIGPLGVLNQDTYNYVNSPFSLLNNIQVTIGSGASGLYGVDIIGGTIDFQTLNPTTRPHGELTQQFGSDGTLGTIVKTTGSFGRLGYAVGHSVTGTYGDFTPGMVFQGGRPNNNLNLPNGGACTASNDLSSCNTALNTYSVSANYKALNDLVKLRYHFTPTTALTLTAYAGNTHSDSTGNGDNDFIPYATRLAQIQNQPQNCPGGYTVVTDANPTACYTAQQFAAASSGPFGGGEDRNRGTSLQDFSGLLTTQIGQHSISLSAFSNYYNYHKYSSSAAGFDPTGKFWVGTGTYQDDYLNHGFLVSDDIASATNDFGFGYFVEHQKESGNNLAYDATNNVTFFVPQANLGAGDYSFFIRENYTPNSKFGVYLNAWERRSSVTQHTTLDPRISFVFKPTSSDIVRVTGGQADGDPSATLSNANGLSGFSNPSSLNPVCGSLLNPVATGGNPNLLPERSTDVEAAYGHRFWGDTAINVVGYVSSVKDQLFSGVGPISPLALANPTISGSLGAFAQKINSACGTNYDASTVIPHLGLNGVFNASSALFRGVEITGRARVSPQVALDFGYDIHSAQQFGEPPNVLANNPYVLDGGQVVWVPVHKATLAADYTNRLSGFEAQLQGFYVGTHNTLNRPAYNFFNGFVSKSLGKHNSLTVSAWNLFNQNSQIYGYFGQQVPNPTNQYAAPYSGPVQQAVNLGFASQAELLGLNPRIVTLQLTTRF